MSLGAFPLRQVVRHPSGLGLLIRGARGMPRKVWPGGSRCPTWSSGEKVGLDAHTCLKPRQYM